ncbi:hypothetical protein J7S89_12870 [Acinetobacter baumannii]|uniref:hypothetical protein n=4 Tax=Acinetobacter baumannii TaxID=470 RepID=UPI00044DA537|nr:hypothetical protein [Acinetobacter baumannii]AVF09410.1 hypothetical protein AM457_18345 [Acinetobacter baumannii]EKV6439505.1 hypothetical protein [Acinetobacter baumannii]EKX1682348.1 hypothetical protein [Acinetobacter baumannii]EKX8584650.1 hypothetical protein [Acinetobacter baumannii]ELA8843849.1 hypothetical protein [Acinetobacter baumannii]
MNINTYTYELANFVCKFNTHNLVDMLHEIILPAFTIEDTWKVKRGSFFFQSTEVIQLPNSKEKTFAIVGRFIRDTRLTSTQVYDYDAKELKPQKRSIQTSPSAIFVLILNNHRLIYLKETPHAPTLEMFKDTCQTFFRRQTKRYAESLLEEARRDFIKEYGLPDVNITPLNTRESLEEFLNQYKKIESIRITLKKRNDELQFKNDLIKKAQLKTDAIKSSTTTISFTNKKDGLDFDQTLEQLDEATEQGNQGILIEGINESGDVIKGNNEKFKVIKTISGINLENILETGKKLYGSFLKLSAQKKIIIPETKSSVKNKLQSLNIIEKSEDGKQ